MPRDTVAEIKNRLSIQDVITPYVKLTRAGRALKGLCPFHKEKTPSFTVSVERGTFHCFGCGVGGDAFSFIEKIEGVDFKGAMALLAEKAGVEVVYDPVARASASRSERLREVLNRTTEFYSSRLTQESAAFAYACERGLLPETIKLWQLGVAPNEWRVLLEHLSVLGFTPAELLSAGVIKEAEGKQGTYYDRFRNRLMFPIRDVAGRVVAFTGRILPGRDAKVEEAKYLNSPETELYHKSEILFGMDKAKDAIRTRGFAILVEGQMDLLHLHQAGFTNAIALSGTAFTQTHAKFLLRYSENLMLALDADAAGFSATAKAALTALQEGMHVKAVHLPAGKDPADLILEDSKAFAKRVAEGKPIVEFFLDVLGEKQSDPHKLVLAAERIVLPLLRAIKSPMERAHFIQITGRYLGLSAEDVRSSMNRLPQEKNEDLPLAEFAKNAPLSQEELLFAVVATYPDTALAKRVGEEYARIVEAPLVLTDVSEAARFRAEELFGEHPSEKAADALLHAYEEAVIRKAHQEAVSALRRAESDKNADAISAAEALCARISKQLANLKPLSL